MSSNQSLLRKADLAIANLEADGGILPPEEALQFVRKVVLEPTLLRFVRQVGMGAPTRKINKIGFGSRILRAGVSGTALSSGDRSKPVTEQIELEAKEVKAEVRIPYDVMEDNIESASAANNEASNTGPGGLRSTILDLIAKQSAIDLELLAIQGDKANGDSFMALQDGYLKLASDDGNVVDFENQAISKQLFKEGKLALPTKYLRDIETMRHFVSHMQETEYRDTFADRQTAGGDAAANGRLALTPYGIPVTPVGLMPDAKGLFCNPQNLIWGIWRQISLEFDKDITSGVYIIVLTARIAIQIEEAEAVVTYENIG